MGNKDVLTLPVPDNWHCHLREGQLLPWMVKQLVENGFRGRVLAMPNTKKPILTGEDALEYREIISIALDMIDDDLPPSVIRAGRFEPVMTIQITEATTPAIIKEAVELGVKIAKVYPRYVTTNSEHGVVDYEKIYSAFEAAEKVGMVVCFHPEHPSYEVEGLDKETEFIVILDEIRKRFPNLRMTIEHVTDAEMVEWVKNQPVELVRATVTVHHLFSTLDGVIGYSRESGGKINVHCGCKPMPKYRYDREALVEAVLSGNPHFFYGGDDAPHLREQKWAGACGVFNTPVAIPLLINLFAISHQLQRLPSFLSHFGADHYGYPRLTETINVAKEQWQVPEIYEVPGTGSGVVPMMAGQMMEWQVMPAI
jgi:dihydroorotase